MKNILDLEKNVKK